MAEKGTRQELRYRYWEYTLPIIQAAHGQDKSYSGVHPSRDNWLNGFFGVSDGCLTCVVTTNSVRAELTLHNADASKNKEVFDMLLSHKREIESKMDFPLVWCRNDGGKRSKIYVEMTEIAFEEESNWKRMADFHAKWTKRFFDVIVPFLKE